MFEPIQAVDEFHVLYMLNFRVVTVGVPESESDVCLLPDACWDFIDAFRGTNGGHAVKPSLLHFPHRCVVFGGLTSH